MGHRSILPSVVVLGVVVAVVLPTEVRNARAQQPVPEFVQVVTFTGTTVHKINLPGKPNGRGGIVFSGTTTLRSLRFTSGPVSFAGRRIDFSGKEEEFMENKYTGEVTVTTTRGPRSKVPVKGVLTASGVVFPNGQAASSDGDLVDLGPRFSARVLDLAPKQKLSVNGVTLNWQSPLMPELNGATVKVMVDKTILAIDAATGLLEIKMEGRVLAKLP